MMKEMFYYFRHRFNCNLREGYMGFSDYLDTKRNRRIHISDSANFNKYSLVSYSSLFSLETSLSLVFHTKKRGYSTLANDDLSNDICQDKKVDKDKLVGNVNNFQKFNSKYKLNKKNLELVNSRLSQTDELLLDSNVISESEIKDMKELDSRINSPFLQNYVLVGSFKNIDTFDTDYMNLLDNQMNNSDVIIINNNYNNNNNNNKLTVSSGLNQEDDIIFCDGTDVSQNMFYIKDRFIKLIGSLEDSRLYKVIFRWQSIYVDDFNTKRFSFNTSPSFFIYRNMDHNIMLYRFINYLNIINAKYNVSDSIDLDVFVKEWVSYDQFKSFNHILETIKNNDKKSLLRMQNKIETGSPTPTNVAKGLSKLNKQGFFDNRLFSRHNNKNFYLCLSVEGLNYGRLIDFNGFFEGEDLIHFNKLMNLDRENIKLYNYFSQHNTHYIIKVECVEPHKNIVSVYLYSMLLELIEQNKIGSIESFTHIEKWVDIISYESCIHDEHSRQVIVNRESENNGYCVKFIDGKAINVEIIYNSKVLKQSYYDFERNDNIGTIDLETFKNDKGEAIPYAIGYKTAKVLDTFYLNDYKNSDDMILDCIDKFMVVKNHNMKLYAHNMGEFDGILILKTLIDKSDNHGYKIKVFSNNDGKLMSIDITKKLKNKQIIKISILDSYLLLPVGLDYLCDVFNTNVKKTIFPYDFINSNTINYKGLIPDYSYFKSINNFSYKNYQEYSRKYMVSTGLLERSSLWETKSETLSYLENDLIGLYEVVMEFKKRIYDKFYVNITRVRTISGLAFLIYTTKYYDDKLTPIHFTKGKLEDFIRNAYMGGIVDVNIHYSDYITFKYDVNSHYPYAMLSNPMPGGPPRISNETNLDNIFGFVEAIVTAPSEEELRVAILPVKTIYGKTVLFRNTVKGTWFSEELKMARDYGYKVVDILSCVQFEKVEGTFDKYIKEIYELKRMADKAKNKVERYLYKLILNSLYGRLGIRPKNIKLTLEDSTNINKILHTENSEVLYQANDKYLVRSAGPFDPDLIKIINDEKLYVDDKDNFQAASPWGGNISSVQYSAAITAYARMHLNKFKNMENNTYLGGDTDSIIMKHALDYKYVGSNLGQFKLEHVITEGFYHSKKFYLLVTDENKHIIKAKGIDNKKNLIDYNSFVELFKGNSIIVKQLQFNKDLKTLNVFIKYIDKTIEGIKDCDINYKMKHRNLVLYQPILPMVIFSFQTKKSLIICSHN